MNTRPAIRVDGKKFQWDSRHYDRPEDAALAADSYQQHDFEVRVVVDGGRSLVYTRRVVIPAAVAAHQ